MELPDVDWDELSEGDPVSLATPESLDVTVVVVVSETWLASRPLGCRNASNADDQNDHAEGGK